MLPIPIRLKILRCQGDQLQLNSTLLYARLRDEEREERRHEVFSLAVAEKRWIQRAKHTRTILNCTCTAMDTK